MDTKKKPQIIEVDDYYNNNQILPTSQQISSDNLETNQNREQEKQPCEMEKIYNGILSLIVDQKSIEKEDNMRNLINLIQRKKQKIEGIVFQNFRNSFKNSLGSVDFYNLFIQEDQDFNIFDLKKLQLLEINKQPGIYRFTQYQKNKFRKLVESQAKNKIENRFKIQIDEISLKKKQKEVLKELGKQSQCFDLQDNNTQSSFYKINLANCFNEQNQEGLTYLGHALSILDYNKITDLSLSGTNLQNDVNFKPILNLLNGNNAILNLDLSFCKLTDTEVKWLFSQQLLIKSINLSGNNEIHEGWIQIFQSLFCNLNSITDSIILNECNIDPEIIEKIYELIQKFSQQKNKESYNCSLIKFSYNQNEHYNGKKIALLFKCIFELSYKSLEIVELAKCGLNKTELYEIQSTIKDKGTEEIALQEMNLSQNNEFYMNYQKKLTKQQSLISQQVLENEKYLQQLQNYQKEIESGQMNYSDFLNFIFNSLKHLRKIDISECDIPEEEMIKIMNHYSNSKTKIESMIMVSNEINEETYLLIANHMVFTEKSCIENIEISRVQAGQTIVECLQQLGQKFLVSGEKNQKLKTFILNDQHQLGEQEFKVIIDVFLTKNTFNLSKLSLKNTLSEKKVQVLIEKMSELENKQIELPLKQIYFDDSDQINKDETMVKLLKTFLLKNKVFSLEKISFQNCYLGDQHILDLLNISKSQNSPVNLKKLILKKNDNLSSNGWDYLSELLFVRGIFKQLEFLDISECRLQEKSISAICKNYSLSVQNKPNDYKQPLYELVLNGNDDLDSSDWKNLFENIIFSDYSQIKSLSATNCGFDSESMEYFNEYYQKKQQNLKDRQKLVNLNFEKNNINEECWKQFIQIYVLDSARENIFYGQQQNISQLKSHDQEQVSGFEILLQEKLNRDFGQNIVKIQRLDLKGTKSINSSQWVYLFNKLIINNKSQIEFLNLSDSHIDQDGWENIFNLLKNYQNSQSLNPTKLKLKTIQFNNNDYLKSKQWENIAQYLFFNAEILQLKQLEINDCKLQDDFFIGIIGSIKDSLELEKFSLIGNKIGVFLFKYTKKFIKLQELNVQGFKYSDLVHQFKSQVIKQEELEQFLDQEYANNLIKEIQPFLPELKTLKMVYQKIDYNEQIKDENISILELFISDKKLTSFSIKYFNLELNSIFDIISNISKNKYQFNVINLYGCKIIQRNEGNQKQQRISDLNIHNDSFAYNKNLITLNLSEIQITNESMDRIYEECQDDVGIQNIFNYIASSCSSIQNLYLSKCSLLSENSFKKFCEVYSKNTQINLKILDISYNRQIKQQTWDIFIKNVFISSKTNFEKLNLSGNDFQLKSIIDFFYQLSKEQNLQKFKVEKLYMKSIGIKINAQNQNVPIENKVWLEFFKGIKSNKINIERIYLHNSLNPKNLDKIIYFLKSYLKDSTCKLKYIYGEYRISKIFNQKEHNSFKILKELQNNSIKDVLDRFKQALISENCTKLICQNQLNQEFLDLLPNMKLDITEDFLKPLNKKYYQPQPKLEQILPYHKEFTPYILCFDYQTLSQMVFYCTDIKEIKEFEQIGSPLHLFLFNQNVQQYLSESVIYKKIFFIPNKNFKVNTKQIYELYCALKNTKIESIIIDYDFRQSELDSSLSERILINIIKLFPPSTIELTNVSINAINVIYTIVESNDNYRSANINNFSSKSFLNYGIAHSWRERLYMGKKSKNLFQNYLINKLYEFLSLFCTEEESYAILSKTIKDLNFYFKSQRIYFNIMMFLTFVYYFICIYCPYFLTVHYGIFNKEKSGVAWQSHKVYGVFASISFLLEVVVYMVVYNQIKDQIQPINLENIDEHDKSFITKIKQFLKKYPAFIRRFYFCSSLVFSQLARFDLYSDVCFIVICFKMEENIIGILSLLLIANQMLTNIYKLFKLFFKTFIRKTERQLITHDINQLHYLSNLIEFEALNDILDQVAPYNIAYIPNNFLFRYLFPSIAGKSISNRIFVYMQKFLLEDDIQTIFQAAFFISQKKKDITTIVSMIVSVICMVKAFYKFMSIKPSSLSQLEYDTLSKTKEKEQNEINNQLWQYRNNMIRKFQEVLKPEPQIIIGDQLINNKNDQTQIQLIEEKKMQVI